MKRIILSLLLLLSVYGFATAQQAEGYPRAEWVYHKGLYNGR